MNSETKLALVLDTFAKIDEVRRCILVSLERGWMTQEEKQIAMGNMAEAEMKLRLQGMER